MYARTNSSVSTQRLLAEPHLGLDASLFAVLVCDWPASVNRHTGSANRLKPVITTVEMSAFGCVYVCVCVFLSVCLPQSI